MKDNTVLTSEKCRSRTRRVVTLLASVIVLLTMATGATIAYMFLDTNGVTNIFTAAEERNPTITETFQTGGWEKANVQVNVGNPGYAVYVRAKVVVNWTNEEGNVLALYLPEKGVDKDYSITYNTTDWFEGSDGYWYYKKPIRSGSTEDLINKCEVLRAAPISGYTLQVDILTQTIQAAGVTAHGKPPVEEAWGVIVNSDKTISK